MTKPTDAVAQVIELAIAPVFLLTWIGPLLGVSRRALRSGSTLARADGPQRQDSALRGRRTAAVSR